MMMYLAVVAAVLVAAIGGASVVLGESDDSPGLQLLGVLLVVAVLAAGTRTARRRARR